MGAQTCIPHTPRSLSGFSRDLRKRKESGTGSLTNSRTLVMRGACLAQDGEAARLICRGSRLR